MGFPPGERFHTFIEDNLREARCIVALWSKAAAQSDWVLEEADYGRANQLLIPVFIEDTIAPLGFRRIQAVNLIGWKREVTQSGYQQLTPNSNNVALSPTAIVPKQHPREDGATFTSSEVHEIEDFLREWFHYLDNHAFAETFRPLISREELEMIMPTGTVRGMAGFQKWHERVTCLFFNESHIVRQLSHLGGRIAADVVVTWRAERWRSPEPKSRRLEFDAYLRLEIGRSPIGTPIMLRYSVEELRPLPGSPAL